MNGRFRFLLLLLFAVAVTLPALAFNPKLKPGINEGAGNNEGNDVKLPIGLPFQYTDGSAANGGGNDNSSDPAPIVYSFELTEDIGPASLRQTHTALEQARSMNAACVLIRINSYSGAIDAAQQIREELLAFDRPIIVYVEDKAISAAALISMAGDSIYMRKGANISQVNAPAPVRKSHLKTARAEHAIGLPKKIEAKTETKTYSASETDKSCVINSAEAVRRHVANAEASDVNEVLSRAGLSDYQVVYYSPGFFEKVIDLLMRPWASLVLIVLIAFGIRMQRRLPLPGPATFFLLVILPLFGVPMYQGGLASGWELSLLILPVSLSVAGPLKNSRHLLLRLLPVLSLFLLLLLCSTGSMNGKALLSATGLTGLAFGGGWMLPDLLTRLRNAFSSRLHLQSHKAEIVVS